MRFNCKPVYPIWTPELLSRIGTAPDHSVCACGALIVSRYGYKEQGVNRHSRRRCTNRKLRTVVKAAALVLALAIAPCYAASPWLSDGIGAQYNALEESARRNRESYSLEQDRIWRAEAVERQRQRDDERRRSEDDWQRQQDNLPKRNP